MPKFAKTAPKWNRPGHMTLDYSTLKKKYLQEALGGCAAGLVVFFVAHGLLLLALLPAQSCIVSEVFHGQGEHLIDSQGGLSSQTRVLHPKFHQPITL